MRKTGFCEHVGNHQPVWLAGYKGGQGYSVLVKTEQPWDEERLSLCEALYYSPSSENLLAKSLCQHFLQCRLADDLELVSHPIHRVADVEHSSQVNGGGR